MLPAVLCLLIMVVVLMAQARNSTRSEPEKAEPGLYQALMQQRVLFATAQWWRVQSLIAFEVGVLAAGYHLRNGGLGFSVMFFGAFLVWLLWRLIEMDREDIMVNRDLMDALAKEFIPNRIATDLKLPDRKENTPWVWWTTPPQKRKVRGGDITAVVMKLFLLIDVLVGIVYFEHAMGLGVLTPLWNWLGLG